MSIIGEFRIGEDIAVALDAVSGDPGTVTAISAVMKAAFLTGKSSAFQPGATGIAMAVVSRPASGSIPAGWTISLSAAQTANLAAGVYGIDAKLTLSSAIEITETSGLISLSQAALS